MTSEESKIDKYSKIMGLPFFFLGIAFLIIVFVLAYQLYASADTLLQAPGGEGMEAMTGTYFRASVIIGAKFLALSILGLVGSWICNKGIMMVKTPKEKAVK
jgi:hypothetical protein